MNDWLLDSDPAIRWQVLCDLTGASAEEVAAERSRVATEGWGARLLALQADDGRWGGAAWNRGWDSTMHALMLLRDFGLDPSSPQARRAVDRVRDRVTWKGCGPPECDANPFFAGEIEPCINGQVAAVGAYFGMEVRALVDRLMAEQLPDGGWNCEAENGSTRSSFNTTICVLEALLEYELRFGPTEEMTAARRRGEEYLLERRLIRRRSTGERIERDRKSGGSWTRIAHPTWWHYDVLRGLEHLRHAGVTPDERVGEAVELVASKRDRDGRWPLEVRYPGTMPIEIDEGEGRPSRWITLRALRVLKWARRELTEGGWPHHARPRWPANRPRHVASFRKRVHRRAALQPVRRGGSMTGKDLFIETWGDGTPVVLVHGSLATGTDEWQEQRPLAEQGFRLVVFDRRGYGRSPQVEGEDYLRDADDIAELMGDGAHLVGHSYGGLGVLFAAARRPEATLSVTVLEPAAFGLGQHDPAGRTLLHETRKLWDQKLPDDDWVVRFLTLVGSNPEDLSAELIASAVSLVPVFRRGRPMWEADLPFAALAAAPFPKLVVSGGHHAGLDAVCDEIARRIGAATAVIRGAGHEIQFTGPPLNEALLALWHGSKGQ